MRPVGYCVFGVGVSMDLTGKVIIVTGAGGLLGKEHILAVEDVGGIGIGIDIKPIEEWQDRYYPRSFMHKSDITDPSVVDDILQLTIHQYGRIDGLINNASINPKVEDGLSGTFEDMSLDTWNDTLAVGLTGAFLMSQAVGSYMAQHGGGVILNISSVLSVIAPDQRLYDGAKKPITYSVEKHALIGMTRYLSTYWPNVRCNALSPAGVANNQPPEFVERLCSRIPAGRMAAKDEYRDAVVFCLTQEYLNGHNLVIDGGYSVW